MSIVVLRDGVSGHVPALLVFALLVSAGCAATDTSFIGGSGEESSNGAGNGGEVGLSPADAAMATGGDRGDDSARPSVDGSAGRPGESSSDGDVRCVGTSGDDEREGAMPMPEAPDARVEVLFPPRFSYTDATTLTVRGSSRGESGVTGVSINGVSASSEDGFRSWHLQVPIAPGLNRFNLAVDGGSGETTQADAFVVTHHGTPLRNIDAMDVDPNSGRVFVSDFRRAAILDLDPATGFVAHLVDASGNDGSDTDFLGSQSLVLDATRHRILTFSWGNDVMLSVDPETGTRSVLSSNADPTGPLSLAFASGITLDSAHQRAFALATPNIIAIDLTSGSRSPVGTSVDTEGLPVGSLNDLVYDDLTSPSAPRLLVSDMAAHAILAVDATTGARTTFSGDTAQGPALERPGRLKLDAARQRLLVVDGMDGSAGISNHAQNRAALVAVDLASGDRTTLADALTGSGFLPTTPYALGLDERNGQAYVANDWGGEVAKIDLLGGTRTLVTSSNVGRGRQLRDPSGIALGTSHQGSPELIVADRAGEALVQIELSTGNRTELSSSCRGSGPRLQWPVDVILEDEASASKRNALVLDGSLRAILRVELSTGDRSELSGPTVGNGPLWGRPNSIDLQSLAFDSEHKRLLVTSAGFGDSPSWLYAVDPATGDRTVLSSSTRGAGPELSGCNGIVLDTFTPGMNPQALVMVGSGVAQVNLETGDRSLFSSSTSEVGGGVPIISPQRASLDAATGLLFASAAYGIVSVNLVDASRALVSGPDFESPVGGGPEQDLPGAVQGDYERGVLYVADSAYGAVFAIDRVSGDRVLMSR